MKSSQVRSVKVGHVVCTFMREEPVQKKIYEFKNDPVPNHHMYVIDNGNTLDSQHDSTVTIIGSPNYGGSGGFTNGVMHALEDGCTHVILNDDDAIVSRESVFRVVMFISMLQQPYVEITIAGTMLDIRNPSIVYESGAQIVDGALHPLKNGLYISDQNGMIELSKEEHIDYSNWTFICIPSSIIREKGLPLPMFVREDDVEYGLRIRNNTVSLPGLYVWHPTYVDTFNPVNYYYYTRNRMIALSCSGRITLNFVNRICNEMGVEAAAYRYVCCEEMIDGMKDYLKGPDYVFMLCKQGMRRGRKVEFQDINILRKGLKIIDAVPSAGFNHRRFTLNGISRSVLGDIEAVPTDMDTARYYRVRKVLYCLQDKGFIAERKRVKAISCAIRVTLLKYKVRRAAPSMAEEYRKSMEKYTSWEFWDEFINRTDSNNK